MGYDILKKILSEIVFEYPGRKDNGAMKFKLF